MHKELMKAIVLKKYGSPKHLKIQEIAKPTPKEHEVLIKVHATAVNDYDWSLVRGKPYLYRLLFGLLKPKRKMAVPGMEVAGTVESIGVNTSMFKVGEAVYGDTSQYAFGSFAEYMCVNEKALIHKPVNMSFEEATSLSHASMLAYQGLFDAGKLQDNQHILINGAGGGVGTFGLQLAKLHKAVVTGVDTGDKLSAMKSMGFDQVIDYKKEDFTKNGQQYDLILDCKTNRSTFAYIRSLKSGGIYATVGGNLNRLIQLLFLRRWISLMHKKTVQIVALKPNKDLSYINELFKANKLSCTIDGPYQLSEASKAIQYFGEGKHTGKVVITL